MPLLSLALHQIGSACVTNLGVCLGSRIQCFRDVGQQDLYVLASVLHLSCPLLKECCSGLDALTLPYRATSECEAESTRNWRHKAWTEHTRSGTLHSWVMLPQQRDLKELLFVEPTTGQIYTLPTAPYLKIEAMWNTQNYWINMQQVSLTNLSYDVSKPGQWESIFSSEHVFAKPAKLYPNGQKGIALGVSHVGFLRAQSCAGTASTDSLTIPPSWVSKLVVPRLNFVKYPYGQRTFLYLNSKIELFAENEDLQGLTMRLSLYADSARTALVESTDCYKNRRDKLIDRRRHPSKGLLIENYAAGRPCSLRRFLEVSGRRREYYFFVEARPDGLARRIEETGTKTIEHFTSRPDKLTYRSVSFMQVQRVECDRPQYTLPTEESTELVVRKMTQKFARGTLQDRTQLSKRSFYVQHGRIRTTSHYDKLEVSRCSRLHVKDPRDAQVGLLQGQFSPDSHRHNFTGGNTSTSCRRNASRSSSVDSVQSALTAERDCLTDVRRAQLEMLDMLKLRSREESSLQGDAIADARLLPFKGYEEDSIKPRPSVDRFSADCLAPYVAGIRTVTEDSVKSLREACLRSLKERLVERANIIMGRLSEEHAKLAKKQAT